MELFLKNYKPMEPIIRNEVWENDDFLYQIKWDGVRILAGISGAKVSLINKKGHERTGQYPELQSLPALIKTDNVILDGEMVVLREGKPSFPSVMQRDRTSSPATIRLLTKTLPVDYIVFDVLYLNGQDLRGKYLADRISLLDNLFKDQDYLYHVQSFAEGSSLFEAVNQAGLEGIVAKRKNSLYSSGKQHQDWYKVKCLHRQNCLVGGYTLRGQQVNSLLLGVFRENKLCFAGKAANGLTSEHWQILTSQLPGLEIGSSSFAGPTPKDAHFIRPQLAVQIEFLEWTDSLQLRFPVIKSFIHATELDCSI